MGETRTQDSPIALDGSGVASLLEVGAVVAFLFLYIWVLEPKSQAYAAPGFAMFFTFAFLLHLKHNDTAAELGIRLDTFGRAIREALIVIAPTLVLAAALGTRLGGGVNLDPGRTALAFLWGYPWALFQEYGLQCVIGRRLEEVIPGPVGHDIACAAIFGALHLPNPFLSVMTFGAAYCFCALFRRCPNLFALALAHTFASTVLYHFLPVAITHSMRVGPGFFNGLGPS
jgi:CAAX prenyl protease-like protein